MTKEETLIVDRLKRMFENVEELERAFDSVADQLVKTEQQLMDYKALCTRAAEALENLDVGSFVHGRPSGLIAELRKAAQ